MKLLFSLVISVALAIFFAQVTHGQIADRDFTYFEYKNNPPYQYIEISPLEDNRVDKNLQQWSKKAVTCLALNLYHEARGSSKEDQLNVASVTITRMLSDRWPDTLCEVVYQPWQFSWTNDDLSDIPYETKSYEEMLTISYYLLIDNNWKNLPLNNNHYYNPKVVTPHWHRAGGELIGAHYYLEL